MPKDCPRRQDGSGAIGSETWGLVPIDAPGRRVRCLRTVHPDDRANEVSLIAEET